MKKKDKLILLLICVVILVGGLVIQFVLKYEPLGQAYVAIGSTLVGSIIWSLFDFVKLFKTSKGYKRGRYTVPSVIVLLTTFIWFYFFMNNEIVGAICTLIIGFLISLMYECASQIEAERFKLRTYIVLVQKDGENNIITYIVKIKK